MSSDLILGLFGLFAAAMALEYYSSFKLAVELWDYVPEGKKVRAEAEVARFKAKNNLKEVLG